MSRVTQIEFGLGRSADKEFVAVEGATQSVTPCTACERFPDNSNVTRNTYDYAARSIRHVLIMRASRQSPAAQRRARPLLTSVPAMSTIVGSNVIDNISPGERK